MLLLTQSSTDFSSYSNVYEAKTKIVALRRSGRTWDFIHQRVFLAKRCKSEWGKKVVDIKCNNRGRKLIVCAAFSRLDNYKAQVQIAKKKRLRLMWSVESAENWHSVLSHCSTRSKLNPLKSINTLSKNINFSLIKQWFRAEKSS